MAIVATSRRREMYCHSHVSRGPTKALCRGVRGFQLRGFYQVVIKTMILCDFALFIPHPTLLGSRPGS